MKTTIIMKSELFGDVPKDLSQKMMGNFFRKLCLSENKPDRILFYGTGIMLLAKGSSNVLDALEILSQAGVDLIACKTCVDYYEVRDQLHTGRVCSMQDVVSILMNSDKVITVT